LETRGERAVRQAGVVEQSIRVDVDLLDQLMNQVGELVLARNQMTRHVGGLRDETLAHMTQRLSQLTTELQETVMRTRLQPIETVWTRLPRMVRDLSLELGRRVRLVLEGGDTELDRTLNEAIRAPLTHLVRNAVDHGIEAEADRLKAGKPPEGTLTLRAWHEGGLVNVEIADDGRGIDLARVERKAVERGLLSSEAAAVLTDRQKTELIFLPGLSTAERVTSVSGRGVGMDVVKSSVERINGLIEVETEPGRGTKIRLKIPLTLAIVPALVVRAAGERYAIPQLSLLAVSSLSAEEARTRIETLHSAPVTRWRGRLLPLVWLRRELRLGETEAGGPVHIVVLQAEDRRFGLVVDDVLDTEEIVVKPLGRSIGRIPVFAGATIMGDGRAALILDVLGLAQAAAVVSGRGEAAKPAAPAEPGAAAEREQRPVLLVRVGAERAAIPLTDSVRLERFPRSALETSGRRPIVKYRGAALPLVGLGGGDALGGTDALSVVVSSRGDASVGFVVDELLDVVHEAFALRPDRTGEAGVLGTTVIQDRVTRVLDLSAVPATSGGAA
jgi:two-component system chemotaxis sensor kinase CheA